MTERTTIGERVRVLREARRRLTIGLRPVTGAQGRAIFCDRIGVGG
jgi:hypothetical protein